MDDSATELETELELIRSIYSGEADELSTTVVPGGESTVSVRLAPQTGGLKAQRYLFASILLRLPAGYPDDPPRVELPRVRGLVGEEEGSLLRALQALAAESAGECCVYAVFELASQLLTELNSSGMCPCCNDPLFEPDDQGRPRKVHLTAACFHSFHADCLGHWWHAYVPPASKDAADAAPSRPDAARAAAKAAEASAAELGAKAGAAEQAVGAVAARLEALRAAEDPPPTPSMVRLAEEELARLSEERRCVITNY